MDKALIRSVEEMDAFAASFARGLARRESGALIFGLRGGLGAGKTTFAKAVAKALGVEGVVTSPTFVIEKIYKLPTGQPFARLIHIDAYRLESGEELRALGWEDVARDERNLVLMEWPENVADVLPKDMMILQFRVINEHTREVVY